MVSDYIKYDLKIYLFPFIGLISLVSRYYNIKMMPQQTTTDGIDAVSPISINYDDQFHQERNSEAHSDNHSGKNIDSESYTNNHYAYRVALVDNKPQFTPASTFGLDDEFWTGKAASTEIRIDQVSESDDSTPPRLNSGQTKFSWTWQIASAVISVAGLLAIVAVLLSIQHNPRLASWTLSSSSKVSRVISSNISPNTLIAIFAAISKAALLVAVADCIGQLKWIRFEEKSHLLKELEVYDEATRGPWGSLKLLFTMRHTALLAALGAFITIVSIAIDPFAQQIISNVTRTVVAQNETASYQVAHTYDTGLQSVNAAVSGKCYYFSIKHCFVLVDADTFVHRC
jgi:hypothetical protein